MNYKIEVNKDFLGFTFLWFDRMEIIYIYKMVQTMKNERVY